MESSSAAGVGILERAKHAGKIRHLRRVAQFQEEVIAASTTAGLKRFSRINLLAMSRLRTLPLAYPGNIGIIARFRGAAAF